MPWYHLTNLVSKLYICGKEADVIRLLSVASYFHGDKSEGAAVDCASCRSRTSISDDEGL